MLAPQLLSFLTTLCRETAHAADLLQQTYLQVHRARRSFRPGLPLRPWAFAIARHVWLMDVRTRSRRPSAVAEVPDLPVPAAVERLADSGRFLPSCH